MNIYISGPMSGYENHNFPAFYDIERKLLKLGYKVTNPASFDGENDDGKSWEYYLKRDIKKMLDCDAICVFGDWKKSRGATAEVTIAEWFKIPVYQLSDNNQELIPIESSRGMKFDGANKLRWDLLPIAIVEDIVKVLTFGATKYADNNWQKVDNAKERYYAALMRHITSWRKGKINDPETADLPHLACAACNLIFLSWFDKNNDVEIPKEST